jgi:hypothetical protein
MQIFTNLDNLELTAKTSQLEDFLDHLDKASSTISYLGTRIVHFKRGESFPLSEIIIKIGTLYQTVADNPSGISSDWTDRQRLRWIEVGKAVQALWTKNLAAQEKCNFLLRQLIKLREVISFLLFYVRLWSRFLRKQKRTTPICPSLQRWIHYLEEFNTQAFCYYNEEKFKKFLESLRIKLNILSQDKKGEFLTKLALPSDAPDRIKDLPHGHELTLTNIAESLLTTDPKFQELFLNSTKKGESISWCDKTSLCKKFSRKIAYDEATQTYSVPQLWIELLTIQAPTSQQIPSGAPRFE